MRRIKKSLILTIAMGVVLCSYPTFAVPETTIPQAEANLQQVSLFKNGLGFFILEVDIPENKNSFSIIPSAAPSHGSFWVSYPPEVELKSLTAKQVEQTEQFEAITITELLRANIGRKVKLTYSDKEVVGVIKHFAEDRQVPKPNPYAPGGIEATIPTYGRIDVARSRLMIIETDDGEIGVDPQNFWKIEFLDDKATKVHTRTSKTTQLDVYMGAPAGSKKLTVSYLAKGITWAPSYIVDITETDEARISAKAEVISEVCDLNDVAVQLITGFPHLQFADIFSPLALKENLAQFLQSLSRGQSERGRTDRAAVVTQQRVDYYSDRDMTVMPTYGAAELGKVTEDLFFYPVENVKLNKGEVCYLPLFTESVPYEHIYKWEIPNYISEDGRYYEPRRGESSETIEEVWHCLKLENTTKVPWTTAPAETVKGGLILGQDTLNYTPVAGETTLRITQAVNVKAEQIELETDRKRDAAQLYGRHYDLVTVEGKLSVTNFQQKAITMEITKTTLSSEVKSSQPEAKTEKLARGLRLMNSVLKLTWTIELEPGERKQLSYVYDVYVRR